MDEWEFEKEVVEALEQNELVLTIEVILKPNLVKKTP